MAEIQYTEGSPWFWRIFGGAIIGLVSILLISHFNNINSNVDRTFVDLRNDFKELRQASDGYKDRVIILEQMNLKDRLAVSDKATSSLQLIVEDTKTKMALLDGNISSLREEIKILRDWNREMSKTVNDLREKLASVTLPKK